MAQTHKRNSDAIAGETLRAIVVDMNRTIEALKMGAQQTLDELFVERLIPFKLSAHVVDSLGREEYIVRFHDARLHSVDVSCPEGHPFKEMVRAAVLDRVSRLGHPGRKALYGTSRNQSTL